MKVYNFELHLIVDMFNIEAKNEKEARTIIKENLLEYLRETKNPTWKRRGKTYQR